MKVTRLARGDRDAKNRYAKRILHATATCFYYLPEENYQREIDTVNKNNRGDNWSDRLSNVNF